MSASKISSKKKVSKKNAVIVYFSSTGNTKKVADAIGKGLQSKLKVRIVPVAKADNNDISKADVVGFGSGIYMWSSAKPIKKFVDSLPASREKTAFTFSTSGSGKDMQLNSLKLKLNSKGLCVADSFSCKGKDSFGPLKWFGGIHKDRPNKEDLKKAEEFGRSIAKMF
ncbi:MAG: flavodoxin domain-containing protein [Nanoarchaeota archaeon]|nr:flavodoxin domain-containing protein [Nanoarchaeota archaeon]